MLDEKIIERLRKINDNKQTLVCLFMPVSEDVVTLTYYSRHRQDMQIVFNIYSEGENYNCVSSKYLSGKKISGISAYCTEEGVFNTVVNFLYFGFGGIM